MGTPAQVIEQAAITGYDEGHARKQQRKDMLTDEQHAIKRDDLIKSKDALTAQLATYKDAKGNLIPEMKDQHDQTMAALAQNQYDFGQLYDPIKAPGRLQQDWHYLRERIHGIKQPATTTTPQAPTSTPNAPVAPVTSPESPVYQQTMGSGPSAAADLPPVTPENGGMQTPNTPGFGPPSAPSQSSDSVISAKADSIAPPVIPKAPIAWKDRGQYQSPGELKKIAAARQKAQQEASLLESTSGPSPQQEAMEKLHTNEVIQQAQIDSTLKIAKNLGLSDTAIDELKQQMVGLKNTTPKPLTGAAGQPYPGPDGLYRQAVSNPDGTIGFRQMPPDWKPNTKAVAGGIVNTKKDGYVKIWVNPYNPSQVVGYQKITPGRQYTGSTSSSSSTDPFGLTTSSSRSTMPTNQAPVDLDLSAARQVPDNFTGDELPESSVPAANGQPPAASIPSGSPNNTPSPTAAPPRSVAKPATGGSTLSSQPKPAATPAQLRSRIPAPPQGAQTLLPLDANGRIPINAPYNPNLIGAANDLLSGKDEDHLTIPQKAKEAAKNLARAYGWGGQGMFNPQQKLQIKEASTFLNDAVNSDALSVLNSRVSREKLIAALNNSEGHAGWTDSFVARNFNLDPKEAEFLRMYRQLTGTISGIASLTRPGRPTEAGIKRLMFELPNPNESHSAADAKERLKRLIKEIDIATQKGNADNLFNSTASSSHQHKEGDKVMLNGQQVTIKKIYPDGTFDY